LPKKYVDLVRKVPNVFRRSALTILNRPLWANDAHALMHFNLSIRQKPRFWCREPAEMKEKWPDYLFACGAERACNLIYVIDTRKKNPAILEIASRDKKLVPCEKYPDLGALYAREMELIEQEQTKLAKKSGKPIEVVQRESLKPTRESRTPTRTADSAKQASPKAKVGDAKAVKATERLLVKAGFKLIPPKRKHSIAELTADVLSSVPNDLLALYTLCDGGQCKALNLRVIPLAEAADAARTFADLYPSMGYIPVVADINGESCFLATKGPLKGYIVLVHHEERDEIKSRSLRGFLEVLAKNRRSNGWLLEDFLYDDGRPRGQTPFELSGKERTAGDLKAARAMLKLAEKQVDSKEGADEYAHLFELALMLLSDKQSKEILALLKHRDHEVRRLAEQRAACLKSSKAAATRKNAAADLAAFVKQAVNVLKKNGLDAHVVNGTDIRIDPGPVWLNVPVFFDRRHTADVWDYLVERAKFFVSLETR
jgi:hypothetical protein